MKWFQYSVIILLVAALFVGTMPMGSAQTAVTATVDTVAAHAGETVTVTLSLSAVEDIEAVECHLGYDENRLEFVQGTALGILAEMELASVNASVRAQHEVWVTGVSLSGALSGEGAIAQFTFKVKDTAPAGTAAVKFTADFGHQIVRGGAAVSLTGVDGGVTVLSPTDPTSATTSAAPTASEATVGSTTATKATDAVPSQSRPTVTVVDNLHGAAVTTPDGMPRYEYETELHIGDVTADPGQQVTVEVSTQAVENLTFAAINIEYDAAALQFVSGSAAEGFFVTNESGLVKIAFTDMAGVNVDGTLATLTFLVKDTAKKGEYRLAFADPELHKDNEVRLPLKTVAGTVHVTKDGNGGSVWIYWVIGACVAVGIGAAAFVVVRRKKAAPSADVSHTPTATDISDEDI